MDPTYVFIYALTMLVVSSNIYFEYHLDEENNNIKNFEIFEDNFNKFLIKPLKNAILQALSKTNNKEFSKLKKIFSNLN